MFSLVSSRSSGPSTASSASISSPISSVSCSASSKSKNKDFQSKKQRANQIPLSFKVSPGNHSKSNTSTPSSSNMTTTGNQIKVQGSNSLKFSIDSLLTRKKLPPSPPPSLPSKRDDLDDDDHDTPV